VGAYAGKSSFAGLIFAIVLDVMEGIRRFSDTVDDLIEGV
jgi:hypothetical protein